MKQKKEIPQISRIVDQNKEFVKQIRGISTKNFVYHEIIVYFNIL